MFRCQDRTESGSYLGAFLCPQKKCGGPTVPDNPRDEESDYICLNCEHSFSNKYAQRILKNAEADIRNIGQGLDLLQHLEVYTLKSESSNSFEQKYIVRKSF